MLAFVALAIPTFCMGGTLPALGAFIDRGRHQLGRTAGLLYVVNTAGAALGVLAFPFAFFSTFGAALSLILCVLGNLFVAGLALRINRRTESPIDDKITAPSTKSSAQMPFILAFASGAISFIAQVLWNRAFAQVHENSLYSFAIITAVFIAALAVGGEVARVILRRSANAKPLLGMVWMIAGVFAAFSPLLFVKLTNQLSFISAPTWFETLSRLTGLAFAVAFPIAALIGFAFPIILELAGKDFAKPSGDVLGRLLCVNLFGAVAGAILGGFVLPETAGLWRSIILSGLALAVFGLLQFSPRRRIIPALVAALIFALTLRLDLPRVRAIADRGEKVVAVSEGAHGIVAVVDYGDSRRLKLNNSYVLGGTFSTGDERMQSHIPLLMHPNPQRIVYMGLGTGISAGGSRFHSISNVTVLELVPEVTSAAREYFADENLHILDQPNTRVITEDARNFLRHTSEKFDVIIGDLVVPWKAGEAALFTKENFRAGNRALAPGGIFCQWTPLFQISPDEFQVLLNTFLSVFPEAYLWRGDFSPDRPAVALIGFAEGGALNARTIHQRLAMMKADPANPQLIDDFAVWMNFIGIVDRNDVNPKWRINSENRPWIELTGPISHPNSSGDNLLVGRRWQKWYNKLRGVSLARFDAGEREFAAMRAGEALMEFTLCLSEQNQRGAARAQEEIQQLVPPNVYRGLFPPER
jgi:spermidine synthase